MEGRRKVKPLCYLGLVHYPIYNKNKETIATAITNFDVHDISRSAKTYELSGYFLIHPLEIQQELVRDMLGYWQEGFGSTYNPDRKTALSVLSLINSVSDAKEKIKKETGLEPILIGTDAGEGTKRLTYRDFRKTEFDRPILLLFGTGWGMTQELMDQLDFVLDPIRGCGDYNHLSVRSAVAIILDRLFGENWWD